MTNPFVVGPRTIVLRETLKNSTGKTPRTLNKAFINEMWTQRLIMAASQNFSFLVLYTDSCYFYMVFNNILRILFNGFARIQEEKYRTENKKNYIYIYI